MHCRFCESYNSDTDSDLVDHLRKVHPPRVEGERLPPDVHNTDATYEKARRTVHRWRGEA